MTSPGWLEGYPFLFSLAHEAPKQFQRVGSEGLGNGDESNDIKASLAAFVFREERLGLAELLGERLLTDTGFMSRCDKKRDEAGIFGGFEGFIHGRRGKSYDSAAVNLIPDREYPQKDNINCALGRYAAFGAIALDLCRETNACAR